MPSRPTESFDDPIEYIWSLARMCYVAQVSLWRREGEALEASDSETAGKLRDYQIALYSSAIQIASAEEAIRASVTPDDTLIAALMTADADVQAAVTQLETLDAACTGAEALINALAALEAGAGH